MVLTGTIVNALAIVLGGFIGLLIKAGLPERITKTVMHAVGLCVLLIGLSGALSGTKYLMAVIVYMVIGALVGELLKIEDRLDRLGKRLEMRFSKGESDFAKGFVTASLLFCVGAMAIMGALESGIKGNHEILFSKAILDGITALIFASTLGVGVLFSGVAVFIYQGSIALLSGALSGVLTDVVITQMSAVGGLLIVGLGFKMLLGAEIKVGNLLPAVFIPIVAGLLGLV